jgi:pimeloyl-ACP methyl ester carboxylesterase
VEKIVGRSVPLVGYSAGAIVALWVAVRRPDLVSKLALISGAFDADGVILRPSADARPPAPLLAAYAQVSPDGADHFPVVIAKIVRAMEEGTWLSAAQLRAVTCPALIMAADDDNVTLEHTLTLYRGMPDAQLAIVPWTSHLLLHEKSDLCTRLVADFLMAEPRPTLMPIRRAAIPAKPAPAAATSGSQETRAARG